MKCNNLSSSGGVYKSSVFFLSDHKRKNALIANARFTKKSCQIPNLACQDSSLTWKSQEKAGMMDSK